MQEYLDHKLECPYCGTGLSEKPRKHNPKCPRAGTPRLPLPADATEATEIKCDDCGKPLGTWGELQDDFAMQGGHDGVFRLSRGRIKRIE